MSARCLLVYVQYPCSLRHSGYLESARSIVSAAKKIEKAIRDDIPEIYVLGKPPGSVVAFASQHPRVNALEVGDGMSKRGWHLNGLSDPPAVHIACTVSIFFPASPTEYKLSLRSV
jgi:glutamate/tyrosine decarboxylase-like PLP-dependent enzyme